MIRRPPRSTRTDTLFPYTTLFRSAAILWLRTDNAERRSGCFQAPGFAELGGEPEAVILGLAPDDVSLLRCAADAARCAGLGVVIAECWGHPRVLDLTATRRLTLAAEKSGVTILLLQIGRAHV